MKIQAKNEKIRSTKLQVPYDGLISIDANGIAVVSEKAADILVNGTNDWAYVKPNEVTDKKEKDGENAEKDANEPLPLPKEEASEKEEEAEEVTTKEVIDGIKSMTLEEMIAMAEEAGYPKSEYEKFAKKDKMMAAYLIKKYNEAK